MSGAEDTERGPFMELIRAYTDMGTFGKWYDSHGNFICYTVERPWDANKPYISCIPDGRYSLERWISPKFGPCVYLQGNGVEIRQTGDCQRFGILLHAANTPWELQGCIAPGLKLGVLSDAWAVQDSRDALKILDAAINKERESGVTEVLLAGGGTW